MLQGTLASNPMLLSGLVIWQCCCSCNPIPLLFTNRNRLIAKTNKKQRTTNTLRTRSKQYITGKTKHNLNKNVSKANRLEQSLGLKEQLFESLAWRKDNIPKKYHCRNSLKKTDKGHEQ